MSFARARRAGLVVALAVVAACAAGPASVRVDTAAADGGAGDAGDSGECTPTAAGGASGPLLPDLVFEGLDEAGRPTQLALRDYREPCGDAARLLVVRVGAAWCGTCRWHLGHTSAMREAVPPARLRVLDLVLADEDNAPASAREAASYRARIDAPGAVGVDARYGLAALAPLASPAPSRPVLPLVALVDTRTLRVVASLSDPAPHALAQEMRRALAALDGVAPGAEAEPALRDGLFTENQWEMIREITVPGSPPPDPTNAHADDAAAADLGRRLFADASLSPSGIVSCRHCHAPSRAFTDGQPQAVGVGKGTRNAPSITLASHARWQFWDGRADTLWMQATGPIENDLELGSSRLFVAHAIADRYREVYEAIFGALPPLADVARFPASGRPGDASFDRLSAADRESVTRVLVNVGKAIAAFERTLRVTANPVDRYAAGDLGALDAAQKRGLRALFTAGCAQCHYGPRLTDDAFHALRFPTGRADGTGDRGRIEGIARLLASELRSDGRFSDAPSARPLGALTPSPSMTGAFKTPTLRGLDVSGPFGHGGAFATLDQLMDVYATAGLPANDARASGVAEPWVVPLVQDEQRDLVELLKVMTGTPAP